jgi:hypothetical protein
MKQSKIDRIAGISRCLLLIIAILASIGCSSQKMSNSTSLSQKTEYTMGQMMFFVNCAKLTDFDLVCAVSNSIESRIEAGESSESLSREELIVYHVSFFDGYAGQVLFLGAISDPEWACKLSHLSQAFDVVGLPEKAALLRSAEAAVGVATASRTPPEQQIAERLCGMIGCDVDKLNAMYRHGADVISRLALYIRSNLALFSHICLDTYVRKEPYMPDNIAYLYSLYLWSNTVSETHFPGLGEIKKRTLHDGIKRMNPDDYRFMNVGGPRSEVAKNPVPYIRYCNPIYGAYYEIWSDGKIHSFADDKK